MADTPPPPTPETAEVGALASTPLTAAINATGIHLSGVDGYGYGDGDGYGYGDGDGDGDGYGYGYGDGYGYGYGYG